MRLAQTFPTTPFDGVVCCGLAATLDCGSCGGAVGGGFDWMSCRDEVGGAFGWVSFCGGEVGGALCPGVPIDVLLGVDGCREALDG